MKTRQEGGQPESFLVPASKAGDHFHHQFTAWLRASCCSPSLSVLICKTGAGGNDPLNSLANQSTSPPSTEDPGPGSSWSIGEASCLSWGGALQVQPPTALLTNDGTQSPSVNSPHTQKTRGPTDEVKHSCSDRPGPPTPPFEKFKQKTQNPQIPARAPTMDSRGPRPSRQQKQAHPGGKKVQLAS